MGETKFGLSVAQWNEIKESALRLAAESFAKYPAARFTGAEVTEILTGAADENPTRSVETE